MLVGVQGIGWKGVGVGEAFGADVTMTKGEACCDAGAMLPHPASSKAAMMDIRQMGFIAKVFAWVSVWRLARARL